MAHHQHSALAILRRKQVQVESGLSRSTIYLRITQGLWPRGVSLGPRAKGWPASEVAAINAARIAGKSDDDIRALVTRLEAQRKTAAHHESGH
jgi:prophage regulatory protein